ncbi:MAG: hypothetical protein MUC54_05490, partial [Chloroflexi bacterium]|nr:hypothetical protein [Chloroflexota bacterium]
MPELDPFETRLARAVGAFADRANTAVDAAEVARAAAGPEGAATGVRMGRGLSFTWALLLVGLLVGLVAGSWRSDLAVVVAPSPTPVISATNVALAPTGIDVLVSAPGSYTHLV